MRRVIHRQGNRRRPTRPARPHLPFARGRVFALAGLLLAVVLAGCSNGATPTPAPSTAPTPPAFATPSGDDRKIDTALLDLVQVYRTEGQAAAERRAREIGLLNRKQEARLTLVLSDKDTAPVEAKVKDLGGRVVATSGNLIEIAVPLNIVGTYANSGRNLPQDLAAFGNVREVLVTPVGQPDEPVLPGTATRAETRAALAQVVSEGVKISGADGWHGRGITGKGVKVGIIDGGFTGYERLLGRELPAKVTPRAFTSENDLDGGEHGTACAEIVHAMAPDAELYLAAVDGPANLHRAIRWLVDEVGVKVISMSLGWNGYTRGDGSGTFAEAVDYARGKGVFFVKSAGNEGDASYAGAYTDSNGNGWHEFAPGKEALQVRAGQVLSVVLNWDAWTGDPVNLDLYIYDAAGTTLAGSSRNVQDGNRPPVERLAGEVPPGQTWQIRIRGEGRPRAVPVKIVAKNALLERGFVNPRGSISTPGDAKGSFTIGATHWRDDKLEGYSSQGPTADGRLKPEITAPTVVNTASYGSGSDDEKFNGTSAAAPHAAGAAALIVSAQPGITPDQIAARLEGGAKDLEEPGPENKTGHGRLQLGDTAATPGATGGRTAAPAGNGPAFTDAFANPASGLPNGGEGRYAAGQYVIAPNAAGRAAWGTYGAGYGNATVEVTVQLGGAPGTAGILFWQNGAEDYHLFSITADGQYQIARYGGGRWTSLTPWTRSPAITGGANQLKLETRGAAITVSANGQTLGTVQAAAAGAGQIGLLAATFGQPGTVATFSDLRVTPGP